MLRIPLFTLATLLASALSGAALAAGPATFPAGFETRDIPANGTTLHVRTGGHGPAVVLLHGYGETGDMWGPLAADLARDHTVIVPDLRGMGLSARPGGGYDKKTQGEDVAALLRGLGVTDTDLVTHDIGNMVGYAFAAEHRDMVRRFVIIDAPLPGVGPWEEILKNPLLWHFRFGGPDMERLVAGRERIYLDRFWNEFSAHPDRFSEESRAHYAALYAAPGAMHAGFAQFAAFDQDAVDNKAFLAQGKLDMPVLALGGEKSFGLTMAQVMGFAANKVTGAVVPDSGHWIMEENPSATVSLVGAFLRSGLQEQRLTPQAIAAIATAPAAPGTSGVAGLETRILSGDPTAPGPYTIQLTVPPRTRIAAHRHRDDRTAVVVAGQWSFGYGPAADASGLTRLPAGSVYTEPVGRPHYAETGDEGATVVISGTGPSDTTFEGR
jgi:pimeloyl-ACP methyl ester carboxylesterase/quercetin dioxygenase-like cupin family protein